MRENPPENGPEEKTPLVAAPRSATLRALGAEHIVNTSEEGWEAALKDKIKELGVQFAFDAVAGEMTGKLLSLLPNKGTCFVYGRLSNQPCAEIQPLDLIYRRKKLEGFFLTSWITAGGLPESKSSAMANSLQKLSCLLPEPGSRHPKKA